MNTTISSSGYIDKIKSGDRQSLSRAISLIENDLEQGAEILLKLKNIPDVPVLGITGPPGAGKSSLINCLLNHYDSKNKAIAVLAIDPSSPFTGGSFLGDRIRFTQPDVHNKFFIRSLATRGVLGGISSNTTEIIELLKVAGFDLIIIETAGIGQNEMDISYISDITVLVLVPESGDEIQIMKSGITEAADIVVVNKSDREGAENFFQLLMNFLKKNEISQKIIPVIKTITNQNTDESNGTINGITTLSDEIEKRIYNNDESEKKAKWLRKGLFMLKKILINRINLEDFENSLKVEFTNGKRNLVTMVNDYIQKNYDFSSPSKTKLSKNISAGRIKS